MDYTELLLGPIYAGLGVSAALTPSGEGAVPREVFVIDKTAGVDVSGAMDIMSLRPAATVRTRELAEVGIAIADLDGGTIIFNGRTWRIDMHHRRPSPDGDLSGEIMIFLEDRSRYV